MSRLSYSWIRNVALSIWVIVLAQVEHLSAVWNYLQLFKNFPSLCQLWPCWRNEVPHNDAGTTMLHQGQWCVQRKVQSSLPHIVFCIPTKMFNINLIWSEHLSRFAVFPLTHCKLYTGGTTFIKKLAFFFPLFHESQIYEVHNKHVPLIDYKPVLQDLCRFSKVTMVIFKDFLIHSLCLSCQQRWVECPKLYKSKSSTSSVFFFFYSNKSKK